MLTVGIIGDFDPFSKTHCATDEALSHAARALATTVTVSWLPTRELEKRAVEQKATEVAGAGNVTDQMTVKPDKNNKTN